MRWGILDVEGWRESLDAAQLDPWVAYDLVEPIGGAERQPPRLTPFAAAKPAERAKQRQRVIRGDDQIRAMFVKRFGGSF